MKTTASLPTSLLFDTEMSLTSTWPTVRSPRPRKAARALSFAPETQIGYKEEMVCGVIMILCLLFGLTSFVAQFAVA